MSKNWNEKLKKRLLLKSNFLKNNYNNSNMKHIKIFNIKFIWILKVFFEIIINIIHFFKKFKININDVIDFFGDEFPPFCEHKKDHQHQQNIFIFEKILYLKNDIIL